MASGTSPAYGPIHRLDCYDDQQRNYGRRHDLDQEIVRALGEMDRFLRNMSDPEQEWAVV
jgi:hypothetical protein